MVQRYFTDAYRFIPPYRGTIWCKVLAPLVTHQLRKDLQIPRWKFTGLDRLAEARKEGAGVLLATNHSRLADTFVLGRTSVEAQWYFYYMASYHLFRESAFKRWIINRLGAFSVYREGVDREALREASRILAEGERPLVVYPEGTWFRRNDRLGILQEGIGLIVRQALLKKERPIKVFPTILKYWYLDDPSEAISQRLGKLENDLGWRTHEEIPLIDRIDKLGEAQLVLKELEYRGEAGRGPVGERLPRFVDETLSRLEAAHGRRHGSEERLERIRTLRQALVKELFGKSDASKEAHALQRELTELLQCELFLAQDPEYHRENPTIERLAEALQRLEESLTDSETPVAPMGVHVEIGEPIDAAEFSGRKASRGAGDPLVQILDERMRGILARHVAAGSPFGKGSPPAK